MVQLQRPGACAVALCALGHQQRQARGALPRELLGAGADGPKAILTEKAAGEVR